MIVCMPEKTPAMVLPPKSQEALRKRRFLIAFTGWGEV